MIVGMGAVAGWTIENGIATASLKPTFHASLVTGWEKTTTGSHFLLYDVNSNDALKQIEVTPRLNGVAGTDMTYSSVDQTEGLVYDFFFALLPGDAEPYREIVKRYPDEDVCSNKAQFVSFVEGDPGVPGDGRIVTTISGQLVPPLVGVANGVTVSIFLLRAKSLMTPSWEKRR